VGACFKARTVLENSNNKAVGLNQSRHIFASYLYLCCPVWDFRWADLIFKKSCPIRKVDSDFKNRQEGPI
jgi:hypothetical protein